MDIDQATSHSPDGSMCTFLMDDQSLIQWFRSLYSRLDANLPESAPLMSELCAAMAAMVQTTRGHARNDQDTPVRHQTAPAMGSTPPFSTFRCIQSFAMLEDVRTHACTHWEGIIPSWHKWSSSSH